MEKKEFQKILRKVSSREISSDPESWSEENPLSGHCAIATLLAQDYFGGEILRASLENTLFADFSSHYRNESDDFTEEQFLGETPPDLVYEPRTREYLLSNENTAFRYNLLKTAFEKILKD